LTGRPINSLAPAPPKNKEIAMPPRNQRDPEATRNALLEAAEEIFLRKGFGNTSLSEIARQAGITKSLIHHYFGSKEGLWREVKTRRFMHYANRQMEMLQTVEPSVALMKDSMAFYFDFLRRNPQIVRILAWMFLEQDQKECLDLDRELIAQGVESTRDSQRRGLLRGDIDPRFIVFVFIGLCQNWFQDKVHFQESFGTDGLTGDLDTSYLETILKIFFEGLLPRDPSP
jgi:TetR/AcrR family transcriptional regulator